MEWTQIREHFERLFIESRLTQKEVGRNGGLAQNLISKLLENKKKGPSVQTFVNAVLGLGMPLTRFFAQLEHQSSPTDLDVPPGPPSPRKSQVDDETSRQLQRAFKGLRDAAIAFEAATRDRSVPRHRPRRRRRKK